ncbi:MAG: diguanylate cyclase, partial [Bryobacterales bacterium]|nr:diguanylate cyclase [Bryobacterales bacterium]
MTVSAMSYETNGIHAGLEPLRVLGQEPSSGVHLTAAPPPAGRPQVCAPPPPPPVAGVASTPTAPSPQAAKADAILLPQVLGMLEEGVCFIDTQNRIRSWNQGAEAITGYQKDEVIGRSCCDRVFMHTTRAGESPCHGDCPTRSVLASGQRREVEMFLLHKQGHRLPVSLRVAPLYGTSGAVIGTIHIFAERRHSLAAIEHARDFERFTFIDALTGMGNRRYTEIAMGQAFEAFARYGRRPALIVFDVDRLHAVNAHFGKDAGDQVLRSVARTVGSCLRSYDFLGRWVDDEFFAILADTHSDHLAGMAEECCRQVASSSVLLGSHCLQTSISSGTSLLVPNDTPETWHARAARNLREAKMAGGNRVVGDPVNTLFN